MCFDIVDIYFWIANGRISSIFDSYLPTTNLYIAFRTITWVNLSGFSPNLMCALILWRSALGLLIGKFRQFLTELFAHDTIMVGYYCFTFYFIILFVSHPIVCLFVFQLTFEKLIETQTLSFARKILLSLFACYYKWKLLVWYTSYQWYSWHHFHHRLPFH